MVTAGFDEHPAVARRRVRLALRRARQGTDLSQGDVAGRLGWSLSKVQRIESGEVAVSPIDLKALTDMYGCFSAEEFEELAEDSRRARRERWWTAPEYRDHLTPATIKLMGFEAQAVRIRVYQPVLVPGVLQTPAVAEHILRYWSEGPPGKREEVRLRVRMQRREMVIDRAGAPGYDLLLDESVLLRDVGGVRLAAEQMEHLAAQANKPDVHVRIIPLTEGALLGHLGPFMILDQDEKDQDDAVMYREYWVADEIIDDHRTVRTHRQYFRKMWDSALTEEVSLRVIAAKAAELRSRVDRMPD